MSRRLAFLAICALAIVACGGPVGEKFDDIDAILGSKHWSDWVLVGRFGPEGPFRVVDVQRCDVSEPCRFVHEGQSHTYEGFTHYALVVLKLESRDGAVSHVVLRSRVKDYSK